MKITMVILSQNPRIEIHGVVVYDDQPGPQVLKALWDMEQALNSSPEFDRRIHINVED